MRTTVTIDADTEALIREEVRRTGKSFKEVLNQSIRRSLMPPRGSRSHIKLEPLFRAPFPHEFADANLNQLADSLDDEATLRELGA